MYEGSTSFDLGQWEDYDCSKKLNYICKGSISPDNKKPIAQKCSIKGFESYVPYRENCFWESDQPKSWIDAEKDCKLQGAHLASLTDWSEQSFTFSSQRNEASWIGLNNIKVSFSNHSLIRNVVGKTRKNDAF